MLISIKELETAFSKNLYWAAKLSEDASFYDKSLVTGRGCNRSHNLWYKNGLIHREDGPASIDITKRYGGCKYWYKNGLRHREDGPACEWSDGTKIWMKYGNHHRIDGPAFEYADGRKRWYLDGNECSEEEFNRIMGK